LIYVLPSVKNEYVDNNSIREQTRLKNVLLQHWSKRYEFQ
jgi:hypothetical protein